MHNEDLEEAAEQLRECLKTLAWVKNCQFKDNWYKSLKKVHEEMEEELNAQSKGS